ncbi:hypothetical protein GQ54DRAFT_303721 [Martensiomyces pterosporus]|nr:hypothetical protein GQ54DRAFT_303721 [Martensiomyces pterosporus]
MRQPALLAILTLILGMVFPSSGSSSSLSKRLMDTSAVAGFRGALLVVNGKQTTCEIALMDNRSGYVAASCLEFNGDRVSYKATYEVYIDNGPKVSPSKFKVDELDVHPSFNQTTYANNIAVVQFNMAEQQLWKNYIAAVRVEWDDLYYTRRTLSNVDKVMWNTPTVEAQFNDSADCASANDLYKQNTNGFFCTNTSTVSIYNSTCHIPYGSVYAVVQPKDMAIAAVYSHSSVYGPSMCADDRQLHYYTILANYVAWTAGVIKRPVNTFRHTSNNWGSTSTFTMNATSMPSTSGVSLFSGDIYSREAVVVSPSSSAASSTPSTAVSASPSLLAASSVDTTSAAKSTSAVESSSGHSASASSSNGISKNAIIAIAVTVPIATILIIIGLFFLYKRWYRQRNEQMWDPNSERRNINAMHIMNELGGASGDSDLPAYEDQLSRNGSKHTADNKT